MPSINLSNLSGVTHTYIITAEPQAEHWPLVIERAQVPNESSAEFTLDNDPFYAYAITSQGQLAHGNRVEVVTKRAIELGKSKIRFEVHDGTPNFGSDSKDASTKDGFEIITSDGFTQKDAKKGNWLIGYGDSNKPYGVFLAEPGLVSQFYPKNIYYLTLMDHHEGTLVDTDAFSTPLKIDLNDLGDDVKVVHDAKGDLVIEK